MEPQKKKLVMERIGQREIPLPPMPFRVPTGMPDAYFIERVPYFAQEQMTWAGAAALQMVVAFFKRDIDQASLAALAAIDPYPAFGTETWRENARRVATLLGFNAISYYPFRYLSLEQIVANEAKVHEIDLAILKSIVAKNQPVYVRLREVRTDKVISADVHKWLEMVGHAMLVVGYDDQNIFVHDPWNASLWGGEGGENSAIPIERFINLWVDGCADYMLVVQPAAVIEIDTIPANPKAGAPFDLPVRVSYPITDALAAWAPTIKNPLVTLKVNSTSGFSLRTGQHPIKQLGDALRPNDACSVRWGLSGNPVVSEMTAEITFEGFIVEPHAPFPYTSKVSHTLTTALPK